jgi:hypothetical protein
MRDADVRSVVVFFVVLFLRDVAVYLRCASIFWRLWLSAFVRLVVVGGFA